MSFALPLNPLTISLFSSLSPLAVLPTSALQIAGVQGADMQSLHGGGGGTIVQYATQNQDGQFFVPGNNQIATFMLAPR